MATAHKLGWSSIERSVKLSPRHWPGLDLEVQPGDLTQFTPMGSGLDGAPFPIRPWDDPLGPSPSRFYGYQERSRHPLGDAPATDPAGGCVYFGGTPSQDDFMALLRMMGVEIIGANYVVFGEQARVPEKERYLVQLRIMSRFALDHLFGVKVEKEQTEQRLELRDLLWTFVQDQQNLWGTGMGAPNLRGAMGGDGDYAKEELCFGLLVENPYWQVYRIWSRAWLVTK